MKRTPRSDSIRWMPGSSISTLTPSLQIARLTLTVPAFPRKHAAAVLACTPDRGKEVREQTYHPPHGTRRSLGTGRALPAHGVYPDLPGGVARR